MSAVAESGVVASVCEKKENREKMKEEKVANAIDLLIVC